MGLPTEQAAWLEEFTGMATVAQAYEDEIARKRAIIADVRKYLEKEKDNLQEAITFQVGKRSTLDQDGSQMTEADATEYGKAELTWDEMMKVNNVAKVMERMQQKMEEPTIQRLDKKGQLATFPLFTEQEIADELFTPLVRERLLPETLVPSVYSETARMIAGSNEAYLEDLREYTKTAQEEDDLISCGFTAGAKLAEIGSNLAGAFPGSEAKLAKDVLKLVSIATNTAGVGYKAIKSGEYTSASGTIIDNIGALMKGILATVVDPAVVDLAANTYAAGGAALKAGIALADGKPEEALVALADGLEAAMKAANTDKDANVTFVSTVVCTSLRKAKVVKDLAIACRDGEVDKIIDGFTDLGKTAITTGLKSAGSLESQGKSKEEAEQIQKNYAALESNVTTGVNIGVTVLKTGKAAFTAIQARSRTQASETLIAGLGSILADSLTLAHVDPKVAKQVGAAYTSATSCGLAVNYLTQEKPDGGKATEAFGKAIGATLKAAAPDNPQLQAASEHIEKGFLTLAKGIKIGEAFAEGTPQAYQQASKDMADALKTVIGSAFKIQADEQTKGMEEKDKKAFLETQKKLEQELAGIMDNTGKDFEKALELLKSPQAGANLDKAQAEESGKRIQESEQSLLAMLKEGTESDEAASDTVTIEKLIVEMQRDQMIMQMALSVAKGGLAMATKWVPALGTVGTALQLAENLMKAGQRAMTLNQWIKNQKDLRRAQDALESSAQNFVKNQAEQFSHYAIQAAFNVAQLIGQVLELSGLSSAAGTALKASAEAGAAIEDVIYEFYKKATVEAAWYLTQKALRNPKNRRLALEARALNPTLAKYSIAWSAMVRENPMARNVCNDIGLSEQTLRQKDSNVKNVVKFMELTFSDDVEVRRKVDLNEDYMPQPVTLTAPCWCLAKVRAEAQQEDALRKIETGSLDGLFATVNTFKIKIEQIQKTSVMSSDMANEYVTLLDKLEHELDGYQPVLANDSRKVHPAMNSFKEGLLDQTTAERIRARKILVEISELEEVLSS